MASTQSSIISVPFKCVIGEFCSQYSGAHSDSRGWTARVLCCADKASNGGWFKTVVKMNYVINNVLLAWHYHDNCQLYLVPKSGLTPACTASRLNDFRKQYMQDGNKECFDKINALRDKKPTPIFLSAVSLKHCNRAYEQVIFDGTQLVVIDGLHRLVGWALHLNDDIEFGSVPVTTFIASPSTDVRSMSVLKCFSKFC